MPESPDHRNGAGRQLLPRFRITKVGRAVVGVEGLGGIVGWRVRLFGPFDAGQGRPPRRRHQIDGRAGIEKAGRL